MVRGRGQVKTSADVQFVPSRLQSLTRLTLCALVWVALTLSCSMCSAHRGVSLRLSGAILRPWDKWQNSQSSGSFKGLGSTNGVSVKFIVFQSIAGFHPHARREILRQRQTVATAGRSYGGASEKFVARTAQKLPFYKNIQTQRILEQFLRGLLQNPRNFSEVAPEVHLRCIRLLSVLARKTGWPRFGSVRLRFGDGTVRAVPVFGSGGSSAKRVFVCFSTV